MHFIYIDESGDNGNAPSSSPHYILSGLIIDANDWSKYLDRLKQFRKEVKTRFGLNQRSEIHASELIRISKMHEYSKIRKNDRIEILRFFASEIPAIFDSASIINICIRKAEHQGVDIAELAWSRLLQRYDMFLKKSVNDIGIVIVDGEVSPKIMSIQRKLRVYSPVRSRFSGVYNAATDSIVEDQFLRGSHHSYFIQSVDVISHLLYRREFPKGSLKKFRLEKEFLKLDSILLKKATKSDPLGIVRN